MYEELKARPTHSSVFLHSCTIVVSLSIKGLAHDVNTSISVLEITEIHIGPNKQKF